jgi:WD40 repeat protein
VFSAVTGAEIARLYHDLSVYSVAFSPDGTRVATASADGTARLFDAAAGTEISRLEHGDSVYQVRFSPDGTQLATASGDHTARLWPASQHRLVEQAAARLTRNLTEHEWKRYFPGQPYRKTRGDLP